MPKLNFDRLEVQLRERCGLWLLRKADALPLYEVAAASLPSPFVAVVDFGEGRAIGLFVGVQHEVAIGGVECVRSGMSGSVLKTLVFPILLVSSSILTKSPAAAASIRVRLLQPVTI